MKRTLLQVLAVAAMLLVAACESVTVSPPGPASLTAGEGQQIAHVKQTHIGSTNPGFNTGSCPSEGWGWHFVLPGNSTDFVELVATFSLNGQTTSRQAEQFEPTQKHAYVYTDGPGWRLESSEAIVVGPETEYNLSHVCTGPDATTTTAGDTSTTGGGPSTTISGETTITQGEVTTIPDGGTTIPDGETTTVPDGGTTIPDGGTTIPDGGTTLPDSGTTIPDAGATTTLPDSGTTLPDAGATTTLADGQTTTTIDVAAGTLEPGQEATTTTEGGGTGDPGEETTTTGDEVAGGSEDTLPYTGAGDMTTGGMAGLLVAVGIVLLLLARRRSGAE